jgi:hypothetical protein
VQYLGKNTGELRKDIWNQDIHYVVAIKGFEFPGYVDILTRRVKISA